MHVVSPATYEKRRLKRHKKRWPYVVLLLVLLAGASNYSRPLPATTASITVPGLQPAGQPNVAWPSYGQEAIGAAGYSVLASSGAQTPLATASIAKVITALSVLQKAPLKVGDTGPTYTVGANDVAIYNNYVAQDGSVMQVSQGEQLTEYQALQALMLPSANNIADSLADWVFGNQSAYATYATNWLQQNQLMNTHIGSDASGFDPSTTSTAEDLTRLGLLALQNPVLMAIAGQTQATLPVVGTVSNYNSVLGVNGITGLKTGNNDADPGAFLFTSSVQLGNKTIPVAGAVMGAVDLGTALHDSTNLASSLQANFEQVTIVKANQQLGKASAAWGATTPIVAAQSIELTHWKSAQMYETHQLSTTVHSGVVGNLKITSDGAYASSNLKLAATLASPSFWWRLTRH